VLTFGFGLDCGLCLSGTQAPARASPRGGTRALPAGPAAGGCPTQADRGARSFKEAEETRHLLEPLLIFCGGTPVHQANGRMDRAR
jgi:hypothetical protein